MDFDIFDLMGFTNCNCYPFGNTDSLTRAMGFSSSWLLFLSLP